MKMENKDIISLGWSEIGENYFNLKIFDDFSYKHGHEYRLSVFPESIMIECFPINYGVSAAEDKNNYDCPVVFKGKISNKDDFRILMKWLEIPVKRK